MKYLILILNVGLLAGCAGSSGGGSTATASKALFSKWTRTDSSFSFDVTGGTIGTPMSFYFLFANGAQCGCSLTITGVETAGNYTLASCTYTSGGTGNPGCSSLNEVGTFTKPVSALRLCNTATSNCLDYN